MEYMNLGNLSVCFGGMAWKHFDDRVSVVTNIALSIARGMKYIHENKIVHGDLKPENILVIFIYFNYIIFFYLLFSS